jgi:hypothetical protein
MVEMGRLTKSEVGCSRIDALCTGPRTSTVAMVSIMYSLSAAELKVNLLSGC